MSGVVALLIDLEPSLRPDDVRRILEASATRPSKNARADEFGAGLVDAIAAVRALGPTASVSDLSAQTR